MKPIRIFLYTALALLLISGLYAFAGTGEKRAGTTLLLLEKFAPPGTVYTYAYTGDTITNSEDDTLSMPSSWGKSVSRFTYDWSIEKTQLSGTTNVGALVQESNTRSGTVTDWLTIDSTDQAATALIARATGDEIYGLSQRLVLQGRGATQSTRYVVRLTLKKK